MGETNAVGRRERKRLETRHALIHAAIELFAARGFNEVTVTEIAEHADVDASTFFRHFGSKEAVLFTDIDDHLGHVRQLLAQAPKDQSLLKSLHDMTIELARSVPFDPELELLRATLMESSPEMHAQVLVHRDHMATELAAAIADRLGANPAKDARPYLVATLWVAAFDWYRRRAVSTGRKARRVEAIVDEVAGMLAAVGPLLE